MPAHFLFPSRQVSLDPEIRDYVQQSFPPGRAILAGAAEVMRRIKHDFTYEPGATTVTTTPSMSFSLRRGVCQDFAHIMISGLRGIPAHARRIILKIFALILRHQVDFVQYLDQPVIVRRDIEIGQYL